MAGITEVSVTHEVRSFGWRVFDLADGLTELDGLASRLRQTAANASRHLARRERALETRIERREACQAFKALGDVVALLDEVAGATDDNARSVEASTLALEAATLTQRIYDLCGSL